MFFFLSPAFVQESTITMCKGYHIHFSLLCSIKLAPCDTEITQLSLKSVVLNNSLYLVLVRKSRCTMAMLRVSDFT